MIYIIIPIYNEEQNILNLKNDLNNFLFEDVYTIIFSDDGSTDNTKKEISIHFSEHKHVVLGDGINRGPGAAFNNGFEYVLSNSLNDEDIIVTIEADCTSDLAILSNMIKLNKMNYSLVLASVYAQGGGFEETSFIRKLISSIANLLFRFVFDVKVLTISSFYRVYSVKLLRDIKKSKGHLITEKGFICMLEILMKAINCNAKIIEVPMVLKSSKRKGKSKMKILKTIIDYIKFLIRMKIK